jgi:hypothetical protein
VPATYSSAFDSAGKPGDCREFKDGREGQLYLEQVLHAGQELNGQQRMSSQIKEVVAYTHPIYSQDVLPLACEHLFDRRARGNKGLACGLL